MEIYIAVNGEKSETIKNRLDFEEVSCEYKINADETISILRKKGYEVHKNGLFKIVEPNEEKIVIHTDEINGLEIFSVLFHMPLEQVKAQFKLKNGTLTKYLWERLLQRFTQELMH